MIHRCYNKDNKAYCWYGEKGIKICNDWINNPENFEKWSLEHGYQDNLSIDRIDSSKDYSPENCRWVTFSNNSKYKSTTNILTVNGISHTGREWSKVLQLGVNTINKMLRENNIETVKEFIRMRLLDKGFTKHRKSHQTWFDVYHIYPE